MKNLFYLSFGLCFLIACDGKDGKSEQILKEAATIHNQAVAIHDSLMPKIKEINELKAVLVAQKDSLTGKNDSVANGLAKQIAEIEEVNKEMRDWMENIVEVPNNEHHHHHGVGDKHDHNHDHKEAKVDIMPEQMLEIQVEMRKNILKIKDKVSTIKQ